ncbi:MAG: nucleotidyl transferase AbiEii/AbiGii toxin family protein [Sediminibacterium sp.]|nr:nucleotidyl transferase AbiEii/AbiGii toxin family protein [Sediminibacterium sp.]
MITKDSYEPEWIYSLSEKLGKRGDPKILEKVIYAFTLLEQLKTVGLDFIFKGGTSLLLLTPTPRRFSIDIDIITPVKPEELLSYLDKVVELGIFSKWVADNERKHALDAPVGHCKFYYTSKIDSMYGDEPILLDVLFTPNPYPQLVTLPITHQWLQTTAPILSVDIPAIESIVGDKLTAFAPNTTGILYEKNRPVEIIKQLYDIAFLFDASTNMNLIRAAYIKIVEEEIKYRKLNIGWEDVLDDTFQACLHITERDIQNDNFKQLQKGISNIVNFIIEKFHVEEAIICAAKTAYLTKVLKTNPPTVVRYNNPQQIQLLTIIDPQFNKFNKLKKSLPEAFFYWYHAL